MITGLGQQRRRKRACSKSEVTDNVKDAVQIVVIQWYKMIRPSRTYKHKHEHTSPVTFCACGDLGLVHEEELVLEVVGSEKLA